MHRTVAGFLDELVKLAQPPGSDSLIQRRDKLMAARRKVRAEKDLLARRDKLMAARDRVRKEGDLLTRRDKLMAARRKVRAEMAGGGDKEMSFAPDVVRYKGKTVPTAAMGRAIARGSKPAPTTPVGRRDKLMAARRQRTRDRQGGAMTFAPDVVRYKGKPVPTAPMGRAIARGLRAPTPMVAKAPKVAPTMPATPKPPMKAPSAV